jgi:hypothetical protein
MVVLHATGTSRQTVVVRMPHIPLYKFSGDMLQCAQQRAVGYAGGSLSR